MKKPNPKDATMVNARASKNRDAALLKLIRSLQWRIEVLEGATGIKKSRVRKQTPPASTSAVKHAKGVTHGR